MTPGNDSSGTVRRADQLHRPAGRVERFRLWMEKQPRSRLYVLLLFVTWLSLTLLISFDARTLTALGLWDRDRGYQVGTVAQEDVFAPRNVTFEDPAATEEARNQAAEGVQEVYRQAPNVPEQIVGEVRDYFDAVREIRGSDRSTDGKVNAITDTSPFYLPDSLARKIVFLDAGEVNDVEQFVIEDLRELYDSTSVADNDIEELPASVITISEAQNRLSEAASRDASGDVGDAVEVISRGFVEPNYVIDRQATEEARDAAASKVEPVTRTIQQNQRIISRGEVVDREDIAQLEALQVDRAANLWSVFVGVGLVVAAEMGMAWYFLERFGRRFLRSNALVRIILAASLTILFTALARLFITLSFDPYLTPLAGLSIIGTVLLGPRLMFLMVVVTSVNVGIIGGNDFYLSAALLLASGFAIYTVVRVDSRTQLLKAGLLVAAVTALVTFAVGLVGGIAISGALWQGLIGLGNGLLSLMLAMVLLPLLENAFNILTPMKLLELSDPGRPLLHKLLQEAPGTFSHSMMVGNLAENGAERIGANALLARVGAYYHDIGKLEHPAYFIENQISQMNPHSTLTASLSARVIRRHVKDGLEIGRAWRLPEEILEIIAQHHGSTRIEYFYRKAIEEALEGEVVREADFRYSSGLPQSKEAGIVMLADSMEATVKSISKPTPKRIEDVVADTIKQKLDDGQFDECSLTMHEIHEVGEAIREALIGFLGPRIEYPAPAESEATGKAASKTT
ncbi:MAG: HD family phosphohydrolase [Rubrobacteraceae bacterium]